MVILLYYSHTNSYNFFPQTYNMPGEYSLFFEEYKRYQNLMWIMKPVNSLFTLSINFQLLGKPMSR